MRNDYIFETLEIEPTYDAKKIKKAYANLVKKYHPEEYPEKWKEIHAAYETALGLAKKGEYHDLPQSSEENPPKPIMKTERVENPPKLPKETDEMDALFDNIEELSRQRRRQSEEAQKQALGAAIAALKQMAAKKRLDRKAWEAFFRKEDMLPIICTGEFLYALGECFTNKTIDTRMYKFLLEQLTLIERYRKDRNITADSAGVSDPLGYARSKIYSACKAKRMVRNWLTNTGAFIKAVAWLLVAALSVTGMYLRWANLKGTATQQRQYEERDAAMREIIGNDIVRSQDIVNSFETVEIGDTKEKMISLYGAPDILQEYSENPEYEEAVYHQQVFDLKIIIDKDIIVHVFYGERVETD